MPESWLIIAIALAFGAFVMFRSRYRLRGRSPELTQARDAIRAAKARAKAATTEAERAAAWREAAAIAQGVNQPALASRYARRAYKATESIEEIRLVHETLSEARRYRELRSFLFKCIKAQGLQGAEEEELFEMLCVLYEGPLNRPDRAAVFRQLRNKNS